MSPGDLRIGDRILLPIGGRRKAVEVVSYQGTRHRRTLGVRDDGGALHRVVLDGPISRCPAVLAVESEPAAASGPEAAA